MKLTRNTEWALIAALILYLALLPGIRSVKNILATPLGKAAGLAAIVYVWKCVSPLLALLLTIAFLRCARWTVWEGFSGAEVACVCENSAAVWDTQSKTCKDANGNAAGAVKTCTCANGYAWDGGDKGKKQCIPVTSNQPPVPPPTDNPVAEALNKEAADAAAAEKAIVPTPEPKPEPAAGASAPASEGFAGAREFFQAMGSSLGSAPTVGGMKGPSDVPMTTGSAGAALVRDSFVPSGSYGGVQPSGGRTTTSVPAHA